MLARFACRVGRGRCLVFVRHHSTSFWVGSRERPIVAAIVGRVNVGKSTLFNALAGENKAIVSPVAGTTRDRVYSNTTFDIHNEETKQTTTYHIALIDTGGLVFGASPHAIPKQKHIPRRRQKISAVEQETYLHSMDEVYEPHVRQTAIEALRQADVVVVVVDAVHGVTPADQDVCNTARQVCKPIVFVVNKCDNDELETTAVCDWAGVGLGDPICVSAIHRLGLREIFSAVTSHFPAPRLIQDSTQINPTKSNHQSDPDLSEATDSDEAIDMDEIIPLDNETVAKPNETTDTPTAQTTQKETTRKIEEPPNKIRVAIVGRPNVGKSSIVNRIVGSSTSLVHDHAGTTRDPIDNYLMWGNREIVLVDTAGLKQKNRTQDVLEKYSAIQALRALSRCDVAVLVLDSHAGVTQQDLHVASYVMEAYKCCILVCNKWDIHHRENLQKRQSAKEAYTEAINAMVGRFLPNSPLVFTSAKTGDGVQNILNTVVKVFRERFRRVSTNDLNKLIEEAQERQKMPMRANKRLKLKFVTQVAVDVPTFVFFVNDTSMVTTTIERFLMNLIRERHGFDGTPIKVLFKTAPGAERRFGPSSGQKSGASK